MTNGGEKSDPAIVAMKPANEAAGAVEEWVEPRAGTEGNADQQSMRRAQNRASVSQALERIRQAARQRRKEKFTTLLHHVSPALLEVAFFELRKDAAPGLDGMTWRDYGADLERRLLDLHGRVHTGAYRAQASRRVYIPKSDGQQRPLAIAGLEDKIVQRAVAMVLDAIYEEEFLGFSYGFRPGRSAHDAMDALVTAVTSTPVNFIVDADIRSFFDTVSQEWLIRFLEHRIGDRRLIRLIQKWLKAGIAEEGIVTVSDRGTGQGSVISPLLANIYLHYVIDLWAQRWRQREAAGKMILVRYADDLIVGFEREDDARRFLDALGERLGNYALELHPAKTRLIEFGPLAASNRERRGLGKPETFHFLGFTFICSTTRRGRFQIKRKNRGDRAREKLRQIKEELQRRMHQPIAEQGRWLKQVMQGYYNYFAVPTNLPTLTAFRHQVIRLWHAPLQRRSQNSGTTFSRMEQIAKEFLPKPRVLHPWPDARFAVKHPR